MTHTPAKKMTAARLTEIEIAMRADAGFSLAVGELECLVEIARLASALQLKGEGPFTACGPFRYEGDRHDSFRIEGGKRIIGMIYASDGDQDKAQEIAEAFCALLSRLQGGPK